MAKQMTRAIQDMSSATKCFSIEKYLESVHKAGYFVDRLYLEMSSKTKRTFL